MSEHDELRDLLRPAAEGFLPPALTAPEVRKLGTARLRRRQAGRVGVGAVAVAAVVGLVAFDPAGLAHQHRVVPLGTPSDVAVTSARVDASRPGPAPTPPSASAAPATVTQCAVQNPAWVQALAWPTALEADDLSARTAAGTAALARSGQGASQTLWWYPGDDRTRGQALATFSAATNERPWTMAATDDVVAYATPSGIWVWNHQQLRKLSDANGLGSLALSGGDIYYVGGQDTDRQLHRLTLAGSDTVVPNAEPGGRLEHGYYVRSGSPVRVWDLRGNAMAAPPAQLTATPTATGHPPETWVAGSYNGQPVYWTTNGIAYSSTTAPGTWAIPAWSTAGDLVSATVAGSTILGAFADQVVGVAPGRTSDAVALPYREQPQAQALALDTAGEPGVLTVSVVGSDGAAVSSAPVVRLTPLRDLPDVQTC